MKTSKFLSAVIMAAMLGMSCSSENDSSSPLPGDHGDVINFIPNVSSHTRGTALSSSSGLISSGQGFDVFAFYARANQNNKQVVGTAADGAALKYENGWSYVDTDETMYWSVVGGDDAILNFHAVSPASHANLTKNITASSQTLTYEVPTEPTAQIDLMSASRINTTKAGGSVEFFFRHLLAQVVFKARTHSSDYVVEINGITLHNLKNEGTFTYGVPVNNITPNSAGEWVLSDSRSDYPLDLEYASSASHVEVTHAGVELTDANRALLVLPHADGDLSEWSSGTTIAAADEAGESYLAVTCRIKSATGGQYIFGTSASDGYKTLYLPFDGSWKMGYSYTYTLVFLDPKGSTGFDESGNPVDFEDVNVSLEAVIDYGDPVVDAWKDGGEQELMNNTLGNMKGIKTVLIPAGTFMMGSPETENGRLWELQHQVTLTKSFYMSKYEITYAQYCAFLNDAGVGADGMYTFSQDIHVEAGEHLLINNDFDFKMIYDNTDNKWKVETGFDDYPMNDVFWYGAYAYAKWAGGSLPTEAQWEYACRAGSTTAYCFGDDESRLGDYAWYAANSGGSTHPVGLKLPNAWGLYDMHGNVEEWCLDWWDGLDYDNDSVTDPMGNVTTDYSRIDRGGGYVNIATDCRSANRMRSTLTRAVNNLGFRVVFSL